MKIIAACKLKELYITDMRNLKQTLSYWLDWKTTLKVIKFNHILIWVKNYGKNQKNDFEKDFLKKVFLKKSKSNRNGKSKSVQKLVMFINIRTVMQEFWYDYIKPKNNEKANLC